MRATDTLITFSRPFLTENEHANGRLEVQNVVNGFALYERIKQQKSDRLNLPKYGRKNMKGKDIIKSSHVSSEK